MANGSSTMKHGTLEFFRTDSLVPYARNAKTHPQEQVAKIAASIREFGFNAPVLVTPDRTIIAGHGRVLAAQMLGLEKIPCVVIEHLDDIQRRAYTLADNRLGDTALAPWDVEMLSLEVQALETDGVDVDALGFDELGLQEIADSCGASAGEDEGSDSADTVPQFDHQEELRAKWGVEKGQIWVLEHHRLLCGDSSSRNDVVRLMDGALADMMITDPPYGVAYKGKTKDALTIDNDDVDEDTLAQMCKSWFDNAQAVCRPGSYWIATVPAGPLHGVFFYDWKARGVLRQVMVWNKDSMVLGHSEYHYKHEPILFGWIPNGTRLKNNDRTKTTVWDFARPKVSDVHPTMKPIDMWSYAIGNHTKRKDCVFDPFGGSGTTLIAATNIDRKSRTIEINPCYVAVSLQRWSDHTGKQPKLST